MTILEVDIRESVSIKRKVTLETGAKNLGPKAALRNLAETHPQTEVLRKLRVLMRETLSTLLATGVTSRVVFHRPASSGDRISTDGWRKEKI